MPTPGTKKGYSKASQLSTSSTTELMPSSSRLSSAVDDIDLETFGRASRDTDGEGEGAPVIVKVHWKKKWWNTIVEATGTLAGMATTAAFIPQVYQIYATGDTSGLSLPMYSIFVTGVGLWIVYGVCKKAGSLILANIVTFCLAGFILATIIHNDFWSSSSGSSITVEQSGSPQ